MKRVPETGTGILDDEAPHGNRVRRWHHRRPHGDPTATERVFLNTQGVRRAYKLKPSDSRVLEKQALERQLKAAAFMPTTKEDKDSYSLSESERRTPTFGRPPHQK